MGAREVGTEWPMRRLAGYCPLGLGGGVYLLQHPAQRPGHKKATSLDTTGDVCTRTAPHPVQWYVYTGTQAQPHAGTHSFIQQCHSARAARARTSDTRDTSQALHHKPPFLKRVAHTRAAFSPFPRHLCALSVRSSLRYVVVARSTYVVFCVFGLWWT